MNTKKVLIIISCFLLISVVSLPVSAKKSLPPVNEEGMELVKDTKLTTIYADPGADLGVYNRIMLADATVAFKKNWLTLNRK